MALVKKHTQQDVEDFPSVEDLQEAIELFESTQDSSLKDYLIDEIIKFHGGSDYLVEYMKTQEHEKTVLTKIASVLEAMDPEEAPIEKVMELLKLENAYLRNLGISILQAYGDAIKYYIVKFLIGDDRDLRIFAINVLGDVNFAESRDMLIELLQNEQDINVAMTAVDYMGEIGEEEDIPLLESLKTRFNNDAYVSFAVDNAIEMIKG